MQLDFWEGVKDFILAPFSNPKVELAFVMLIVPFFVNVSLKLGNEELWVYKLAFRC